MLWEKAVGVFFWVRQRRSPAGAWASTAASSSPAPSRQPRRPSTILGGVKSVSGSILDAATARSRRPVMRAGEMYDLCFAECTRDESALRRRPRGPRYHAQFTDRFEDWNSKKQTSNLLLITRLGYSTALTQIGSALSCFSVGYDLVISRRACTN